MAAYIDVTEASFQTDVLESDLPVLVDFWAPWCGPCRAIAPAVEQIATEYAGKLRVAKVNVDQNQRVAMQYGVSGIPALLVFKGGELVNRAGGAIPKNRILKLVEPAL